MEEQFLRAEPNIIAAKTLHNSTLHTPHSTLINSALSVIVPVLPGACQAIRANFYKITL